MAVSDKFSSISLNQLQCPLFCVLPGEIRNLVFQYALAESEDSSRKYSEDTYFYRPGARARTQTDTALLLTCQRIYNESWFIPWLTREPVIYLASPSRTPSSSMNVMQLEAMLTKVHEAYGDSGARITRFRIYAQLYQLEAQHRLYFLQRIPHFHPVIITIGIRHTDWWWWEHGQPLRIKAGWLHEFRLPDTVEELHMELETIVQRKTQVQEVAKLMKASWSFSRMDGVSLVPSPQTTDRVHYWEGSSIFGQERWLRDESKIGRLEYYIQTVIFRVDKTGKLGVSDTPQDIQLDNSVDQIAHSGVASVQVRRLIIRGLSKYAPADQVQEALTRYTQQCWCRFHRQSPYRADMCCTRWTEHSVGKGWRDIYGDPTLETCIRCYEAGCGLNGGARRRLLRRYVTAARLEEPQTLDPAPIPEDEERWWQMFDED